MEDLTITNKPTTTERPAASEAVDETPDDGPATSGDSSAIDIPLLEQTLEYIRPAIQMDGGDIVLLGAEDGIVNLQMVGACGGCPMSMMTLKAGIERILKDRVPGVEEVNAVA
jgi:Fe-S cluster biogenesis protein NfuA